MIKACAKRSDGRILIIFGLSHEEADQLKDEKRFWITGETFGVPGVDFTISSGSREEILREINENLVQPQTIVDFLEPDAKGTKQ